MLIKLLISSFPQPQHFFAAENEGVINSQFEHLHRNLVPSNLDVSMAIFEGSTTTIYLLVVKKDLYRGSYLAFSCSNKKLRLGKTVPRTKKRISFYQSFEKGSSFDAI